ncbi:DUF2093 domain-containing protein [Sphingomonas soli]|uniref:DUF2093 domain-containing protein n=1 Tax=Sphingomonas soli TaxID=266127 RepID=UPI0008331543|nr:DUF2093 domain-containing protein [Sphingomonas soli]
MLKPATPAHLIYETPEFEVVIPGTYVLCAVSGERIDLDNLKYWSAEFQEAYRGAEESAAAFLAGGAKNIRK